MCVGFVLACTPALDDRLASYHAEVCRLTGASCDEIDAPVTTLLPRRRDRRVEVAPSSVRFFDFLRLQGCRLGELAGYRNSPLGRVMPATRRYRYETEVRAAGMECLETLEAAPRARLLGLLEEKASALPVHRWNALWASDEMEAYWSPARPATRRAPAESAGPLLRQLARLVSAPRDRPEEAAELEGLLAKLAATDPIGPHLRALDRARHHLAEVAERVANLGGDDCGTTEVRLVRLFQSAYLQSVQPAVAAEDRVVASIEEALVALATAAAPPDALSGEMRRYLRSLSDVDEGLWPRYRSAVRDHAAAWAPILEACGALPSVT